MTDMNKEDLDLAEIFSGEEKPLHPDTVHITLGKSAPKKEEPKKEDRKPDHSREDGKWQPTKEHTWMDSLKDFAKWVLLFGGLSFLIFYWMEAGLMAESIAVPSIAVCTALAGWGIGKNATR